MMTNKDKSSKLKIIGNTTNIQDNKFLSASDFIQHNNIERSTTGSTYLDAILGGGIETGSITQFYGGPGSGKSQVCFTTCALLPQKYSSIYIDTEQKLRPERLEQILVKRGIESNNILKNIYISKPANSQAMERDIDNISDFVRSNNTIKLLIVDSLIKHYRVEYQGRSKLAERQQKINLLMNKLQKLANEYNLAIVITNHIQTDTNCSSSFNNEIPVGGNILNFASTHIVRLKKSREDTHALLVKSNYLPNNGAYFIITKKGIENGREDVENRLFKQSNL